MRGILAPAFLEVKHLLMVVSASLGSASRTLMSICWVFSPEFRFLWQAQARTLKSISANFNQVPRLVM